MDSYLNVELDRLSFVLLVAAVCEYITVEYLGDLHSSLAKYAKELLQRFLLLLVKIKVPFLIVHSRRLFDLISHFSIQDTLEDSR